MRYYMKNIINLIVILFIPIITLYISDRRAFHIAKEFIYFEFSSTFFYLIAVGIFVLVFFLKKAKKLRSTTLNFKAIINKNKSETFLLILISLCILYLYFDYKYKIYSETHHQLLALKNLESGEFRKAKLLCEWYTKIYPQRSIDSLYPDPFCLPVLKDLEKMRIIDKYLKYYQSGVGNIEGYSIPVEWNSKRFSRYITDKLSGNQNLKIDDYIMEVKPHPMKESLFFPRFTSKDLNQKTSFQNKNYKCLKDIQIASFSKKNNAESTLNFLNENGYTSIIIKKVKVKEKYFYRIIIPCIKSQEEIDKYIYNLKEKGFHKAFPK